MKQLLLVIAALVAISVAAQAQYDSNQVRKVNSLPATCTAGTTNAVVYQGMTYHCTATNTWSNVTGTVTDATGTVAGKAKLGQLPTSTYAGLPTCTSGNDGQLVRVTDANRDVYSCYGTSGKWVSRNGGVYNIHDFGITGNGTTDDTVAWQALITATPDSGTITGALPADNYKITSTLTITSRTSLHIIGTFGQIASGLPKFTWAGAANGTLMSLIDSYDVTIEGFNFVQTAVVNTFINIDTSSGFSSAHNLRHCIFNAGNQYNDSAKLVSIDASGSVNNENMHIEDCQFIVSGDFAFYTSDAGSISASGTTLTCSDCNFASNVAGKTIRVGKAGAAGVTLVTTVASRTSSTVVELTDAASTTASSARIHIGQAHGVGIYNGPNPNAKHHIFKNLAIKYADKGIQSKTGSFNVYNLGSGFNNYGIYIEDATEPIILEQMVQEGNLVEVYRAGANAPLDIRDARGSNSWQLTEGFYQLDGWVGWHHSQVESRPPVSGKIIKRLGVAGLDLNIDNVKFGISSSGTPVSKEEVGLVDIAAGGDIYRIQGASNIAGATYNSQSPQSLALSQLSATTNGGFDLPVAGTATISGDITSAFALHAVSAINQITLGNDEIEIGGVFRPNTPSARVFGTTGATSYQFSLVACDANSNCSLRSSTVGVTTANSTLSGTNFIRIYWAAVPNASTYSLYRANPANSGQGVLIASGLTGTTYDVVTNPGTGYANWNTLTPAFNQATYLKFRAPTIFVNEVAFTDADATPSVIRSSDFVTANTGATSITNFTNGIAGQVIRVRVADANTTFVNGSTLKTGTGANFATTNGAVYQFVLRGTVWYLIQSPSISAFTNIAVTASAGSSLSLDLSTGSIRTVTFGAGNITSLAATNIPTGPLWIGFIQDSTGGRTITAWNALFLFAGGTKPTLSTAANARDQLQFLCDGTNCILQNAIYDVK